MALIKCPECGRTVSDLAKTCPGCGYSINKEDDRSIIDEQKKVKTITLAIVLTTIIIAAGIIISIIIKNNTGSSKKDTSLYSNRSNYSYSNSYTSSTSKNDDSTIFRNLEIKDFSCSMGSSYGTMQCKVTNRYRYTVYGYFRVNFYNNNGNLIYTQLMSLPDVASGESVVCSTLIPKDEYPYEYAKVDFSQASLSTKD